MVQFNQMEFSKKLKEARIKKEFSLNYVGKVLGKDATTIGRYESGKVIPNAKTLNKLCEILEIYNGDLYRDTEEQIYNKENSKNPFKVNRLYLYYLGFTSKTIVGKYKLIIDIKEKNDYIEVLISDYKKRKTILIGHMLADDFIVTLRTENYKPNYPRFETNQIILNISGGMADVIRGTMMCTNGEYQVNFKKCIVSKKDLAFDAEKISLLELDKNEKKKLIKNNIWQVNISRNENFEYTEN